MSKKSKILLPEGVDLEEKVKEPEDDQNVKDMEISYEATEKDEECFFLMYHMHIQPSEAYGLMDDHRRWLLARFVGQKHMEKEAMERQQIARQVMANPQGVGLFPKIQK